MGDTCDLENAVAIATHGLTQLGARLAFTVFVLLETGNESGSKEMVVQRPVEKVG